jgi:hypothetical protein
MGWWLGLAPSNPGVLGSIPKRENRAPPCVKVPGSQVPGDKRVCHYGEAPAAAASWRAHDGGRQRRTACPLLYRYSLTHTYCSLARLPPTHPFVGSPFSNCIFRSDGAPASLPPASSSLTHTRRMDSFCNQKADQLGSLPGLSFPAVYVGVVECAPASLPPAHRETCVWTRSMCRGRRARILLHLHIHREKIVLRGS